MAIRVHKAKGFTQVKNELLQNPKLSFKARGLMAYMLSLSDTWDFSIKGLATQSEKDGYEAIRTGLIELEKNGHLNRTKIRANGVISDWDYDFYEDTDDNPLWNKEHFPSCGNQILDNLVLDNTEQLNINNKQVNKKKETLHSNETLEQSTSSNNKLLSSDTEIDSYAKEMGYLDRQEDRYQIFRFKKDIKKGLISNPSKNALDRYVKNQFNRLSHYDPKTLDEIEFIRKDKQISKDYKVFLDDREKYLRNCIK